MRKSEPTGDILFDRFWVAYPKKVGKPKAQTAFRKIRVTEEILQQMLTAIRQQTKIYSWDKPEKWKYIPNPATWLNQRRWEDEMYGTAPDANADTYSGCCTVLE